MVVECEQVDAAFRQPLDDLAFRVEIVGLVSQMEAGVGGELRPQGPPPAAAPALDETDLQLIQLLGEDGRRSYADLAQAFGIPGFRCESVDDFPRHLDKALSLDEPSIVVVPIDYSQDISLEQLGKETVST